MTNNPPILRLIDANANRAREALRVLEDYTRFVLNDDPLSAQLKLLRHTLTAALAPILPLAILHRDTEHDVGTSHKTPSELSRDDLPHIITAAGKRLGEALRALEEFLKIDHPLASQQLEKSRYTFYTLEQKLAQTLRPLHPKLHAARLYVLITESACRGGAWLEVAKAAAAGGADILQLREKSLDSGQLLSRAKTLVSLCHDHNILSIINDRPDIALLAGADGLHLGQSDLPATEARKLLGPQKLLGVSTHNLPQAHQAHLDGADYIGAGPTYPSPTKPRNINPGLPYLTELKDYPLPPFAIAGITPEKIPEILATGITRIAVTSAITQSDDVELATRKLKQALLSQQPSSST